jgi:hypothetical protein
MLPDDIMFVNNIPFLVSMACGLNLVTAKHTPSRTAKNLAAGIKRVMALYSRGGFCVGTILMYNKFENSDLVPKIVVNITVAKDHVPEVKHSIGLIKEQGWGILNTLLFKKMPQLMLIELICHMVFWLNAFPMKTGVGKVLSPCEIVFAKNLTLQSTVKLFLARTAKLLQQTQW